MENMTLMEKILNEEYTCSVMLFGNKDDMRKIREYELYLTQLHNLVYTPVFNDYTEKDHRYYALQDMNKHKISICDAVIIVSDQVPEMFNDVLELNKELLFTNWELISLNNGSCYFNLNKDYPLYMLKEE